jgi:hypothetical protein
MENGMGKTSKIPDGDFISKKQNKALNNNELKDRPRGIDRALLQNWLQLNGKRGRVELAYKVHCSVSLIEKMVTEKNRKAPNKYYRVSFCKVIKIPEDQLFPLLDE